MSRVCDICSKRSQKGKKIKVAWGVKYRSIRHRKPNLRKTTLLIDRKLTQVKVCSKCLKSIKGGKLKGYKYPNYLESREI